MKVVPREPIPVDELRAREVAGWTGARQDREPLPPAVDELVRRRVHRKRASVPAVRVRAARDLATERVLPEGDAALLASDGHVHDPFPLEDRMRDRERLAAAREAD